MIPYGRQDIADEDVEAVVSVLRSDWLTTGPTVERFEERLRNRTGGVPVVAVSSGTAALHTAYVAAGLGPGDEVITPPITFIATQAAAIALGATVRFADVCEDTANIDPDAVRAAITPSTKAIVAVDFAGHPADMDELRELADTYGLILIEDAAHSLGSLYKQRPVGSLADITAFSFFPTKNLTTAEGGAVVVKDPQMRDRARRFARQGITRDPTEFMYRDEGPWHQEVHEFGLNYRLSDVQAALGMSQLKRLALFKRRRQAVKALYDTLLSDCPQLRPPVQREYVDPMWHLYPLRVPSSQRRGIFEFLRRVGVGVQVNYLPVYLHPVFRKMGYAKGLCVQAEAYYAEEISLPMFSRLDESTIELITHNIKMSIYGAA